MLELDLDARDEARRVFSQTLVDVLRLSRNLDMFTPEHGVEVCEQLRQDVVLLAEGKPLGRQRRRVCVQPWHAGTLVDRQRIRAFNAAVHPLVLAHLKVCLQMKSTTDVRDWLVQETDVVVDEYFDMIHSTVIKFYSS